MKLFYLSILAATLGVGFWAGRALAKRALGRLPAILLAVIGGITFLIGQAEADFDHRFRLLALVGLGLQVAALGSVFGQKRTLKARSVDLWASQK